MKDSENFVRSVLEMALFFRDMEEEGEGGDTGAIKLLSPWPGIKPTEIRRFALQDLFLHKPFPLTSVAMKLAAWCPDGKDPKYHPDDIGPKLRTLCAEHERDRQELNHLEEVHEERKVRAFLRLARQIPRIRSGEVGAHSRVFEYFVPEKFVPIGHGKNGGGHREHVVPCAYLREECVKRYKDGMQIDELAKWVRPYVVIVNITKEEAKHLDGIPGLKKGMPEGWSFDHGCIFERLYKAEIDFDPPKNFCCLQSLTKSPSSNCYLYGRTSDENADDQHIAN